MVHEGATMAELQLTEEQQGQIASLLAAVGQDAAFRERFRADPRTVLDEHGLAHLVPNSVQLEVEVEEPQVGGLAAPGRRGIGLHFDIPHVDQHLPDPLPPDHWDWAHMDAPSAAGSINVTPVFRIKIMPMSSTAPR
jgi:hypothetical protein